MTAARIPAIFGLQGTSLTVDETAFFREHSPAGYIVFARNCADPVQLRKLTDALKVLHPDYTPLILIDQEGGRVARLKPPHWRQVPSAGLFASYAPQDRDRARRLVYLNARLIAADLIAAGINTDCAPLADLPVEGSHSIIGDRAYGDAAEQVADLAGAMAEGLSDGGILPVLKHIPGHGRADVDSHEDLPVVNASLAELRATDFQPFASLKAIPLGMTAHIRYTAIDAEQPATLSRKVIDVVRDDIGFLGLLMTDDLSMKALKGDFGDLAQRSLAAGCDLVLHCNGDMAEMQAIAAPLQAEAGAIATRLDDLLEGLTLNLPETTGSVLAEYRSLAAQSGLAA